MKLPYFEPNVPMPPVKPPRNKTIEMVKSIRNKMGPIHDHDIGGGSTCSGNGWLEPHQNRLVYITPTNPWPREPTLPYKKPKSCRKDPWENPWKNERDKRKEKWEQIEKIFYEITIFKKILNFFKIIKQNAKNTIGYY